MLSRKLIPLTVLVFAGAVFAGKINGGIDMINSGGIGGGIVNGGDSGVPSPVTFDLDPESTPDNLTSSLTINGTEMTILADYDARDATTSTWAADTTGPSLVTAGSGDSPTVDELAPFTGAGESVRFAEAIDSGEYYESATGNYAAVGTQDFVIEAFFKTPNFEPGGDVQVIGSYTSDLSEPNPPGLYYARGNELWARFRDADINLCQSTGIPLPNGTWHHVMVFASRSGTMRINVNGENLFEDTIVPCSATTDNGDAKLQIGSDFDVPMGGGWQFAFGRIWKCNGCIGSTGETDSIAAERVAKLMGAYADAGATQAPSIMSRASYGTVDIQNISTDVRTIFLLGNHLPRVARRKELSGGEYVTGILIEGQRTNKMITTEEFDNQFTARCSLTDDSDCPIGAESDYAVPNTAEAPNGEMTADSYDSGLEGSAREHCFRQPVALTASKYTTSFFLKADERTKAIVRNRTIANGAAWVNLSTCTALSKQANVLTSTAESYGNGWCRFSISYTGTAATHNIDVCAAETDGVTTFVESTGNGTPSFYVWGAQTVLAGSNLTGYVTSYIPNPNFSDTTRVKDHIAWVSTGNINTTTGATCDFEMMHSPSFSNAGDDLVTCFVGAAANDNMFGDIYGNNHGMYGSAAGSGVVGFQAGPTVITGERVQARITFKDNEFCQYVDGSLTGSCDTGGTSPTVPTMTRISLGANYGGNAQVDGLVSRLRWLSGTYAGSLQTY